jgi:ribosomal protein L4
MSTLKRILRELTQEIERLAERNEMLERRLSSITGALQGTVRIPRNGSGRVGRTSRRAGRRGAPPKFSDAQAVQLRREYEKGATSAQLARKYKAALPTILGTLRRAGASLRRGRPPKRK